MRQLMLVVVLSLTPALPGRSATTVCGGGAEFAGSVVIEALTPGTVELEWSIWEDAWTRQYRLSRHPPECDKPSCTTTIATLAADSDTPSFETQALRDTAPPGLWVYQLEVRRAHGDSCVIETPALLVPEPVCDTHTLCSQLEQSLAGGVVHGGSRAGSVEIQWLTSAETPAVEGYRLSRYDCGDTADCIRALGTVDANGSCGQPTVHGFVDTPPPGAWTWRLEVLGAGGRVLCSLDREVSN